MTATDPPAVQTRMQDALTHRRIADVSGPLAAAASLVGGGAQGNGVLGADPAAVLAALMDLHGSVALARELELLERRPAPPPSSAAEPDVRALLDERLDELTDAIDHMFGDPFQRRNKLPDADAMLALLESGGVLARSGAPLAAAAGRAWEPFGELAARAFGRIRLETRTLREELAPGLRALGPGAARIERLDAALSAATQKGRERVLGELLSGLARCFSRGLRAAVASLPDPAGAGEIALWYANDAWLRRELERMAAVLRAVLSHESGRLRALADAATLGERDR